MSRFAIPLTLLVIGLGGLIAYSKIRTQPNRVSGFIEADEIRLGSRLGGRVAEVLVVEGELVAKGQVLLRLEPFDLLEREKEAELQLAALEADFQRLRSGFRSEEIAQAKAKYDQLRAQLDLLEAGPREQEIEVAEARLRAAEAEQRLAGQLFERQASLVESNAIPAEEFERTKQAYETATSNLSVRENELELLKLGAREEEIRAAKSALAEAQEAWELRKAGNRKEEVDRARAARDAALASLEAIRRQKDELEVSSPVVGVVESLDLQPGDMVAAGAPVLSLLDHNHLWVRAYVPQNRVGLQVGQRVAVTIDSLPNERFESRVSFISRQAEFTPSNVQTSEERAKQVFRIKVVLPKSIEAIRPGMTADVWLDSAGDGDGVGVGDSHE